MRIICCPSPICPFSLPAFLQSRPTETHLRFQVCPKVGRQWRAVATSLNILTTTVDKVLESHKHDVGEAFFRVLCLWRAGEGATWEALLDALRETGLNTPVRELLEWIESGAASVSIVVMMWSDAYRDILL